jgi:hypothetical protein
MKVRPLRWIVAFLAIVVLGAIAWNVEQQETADILVFKSPQCDCCDRWVAHLRQQGFKVYVSPQEHLADVRAKYGVPERLAACHTARAGGYTIEGHVPAADIRLLLRNRPAIAGLAVPGMPIGSPGMEQGDRHDPYAVLTFDGKGRTSVFGQH